MFNIAVAQSGGPTAAINASLAGVFAGEKLLVTYESSASPLDTRVVAATIEHYLK